MNKLSQIRPGKARSTRMSTQAIVNDAVAILAAVTALLKAFGAL